MNTCNLPHPTLKDLKYEIDQVLVYWCFLEAEIRRQLDAAGKQAEISKGPIIGHWSAYVRQSAVELGHGLIERYLDPVEKIAVTRNLIAHGIRSLTANPWEENTAVIVCSASDGNSHFLSIGSIRELSEEIDKVRLSIGWFPEV